MLILLWCDTFDLYLDYVLCRNESSAKKKEELIHLLRLFARKVNNDQQYRKKVRTTILFTCTDVAYAVQAYA